VPRRDEQGKILNWYGVGTDIEDRKRAEEAARRRESELRELIEAIPAVTWSAGPGGSRTFISKNWTELTGLSPENALGFGWLTAVHPEDAERHLSRWQEAIEAGVPFEGEVRVRHADGDYRWVLARAVPLPKPDIGAHSADQWGSSRSPYFALGSLVRKPRIAAREMPRPWRDTGWQGSKDELLLS